MKMLPSACTWTLNGTGNNYTLTISGNGAMGNYSSSNEPPWVSYWYWTYIKTVVIEDGVTSIGTYAFRSINVTSVTIPNSVTSIGTYAFYNCSSLTNVTIGSSVTAIGEYVFPVAAT